MKFLVVLLVIILDLNFHVEAKSETKNHIIYPPIIGIGKQNLATSAMRRDFFRKSLKVKSQPTKAIFCHLRKNFER